MLQVLPLKEALFPEGVRTLLLVACFGHVPLAFFSLPLRLTLSCAVPFLFEEHHRQFSPSPPATLRRLLSVACSSFCEVVRSPAAMLVAPKVVVAPRASVV